MTPARVRIGKRMLGAGVGLALDRFLGEPPSVVHPVAIFGELMENAETFLWRGSKASGACYATVGVSLASIFSQLLGSSFVGTALATYLCVAERSLLENAAAVKDCLERDDIEAARARLPSLVGRDVTAIDISGAASAAVESVAENSSDAVVAPMLYGAVFGSAGALIYRAVNTMDAMVGYKSAEYRDFGWSSARLDDMANYLPARIAAVLSSVLPTGRFPRLFRVRRDAVKHPSPNAGVIEAMYAHKLGIRLGGAGSYQGKKETRPEMGCGRAPSALDIARASDMCRQGDTLLSLLLVLFGGFLCAWPRGRK